MKEANKTPLDTLICHYRIQSKPVDSAAVPEPSVGTIVGAIHPGMAMDVLEVAEMGPVRHATPTNLVLNSPRQIMFSAFPSLIP
ncbi:unnamed protein product, partial [Ixodes pacificus]